jgi:nucleoside 2-deoxyribosyltransferase
MPTYGSTIERDDVQLLEKLGFEVLNPNNEDTQRRCQEYIEANGRENSMKFFEGEIDKCDCVAFRALPDGSILSGVGYEICYAINCDKPVFEMPRMLEQRSMAYHQTKAYLYEVGYRKA